MDQHQGKTILLVDDEAIIAMSEKQMLEKNGYTVHVACSGEEAVQTAEKQTEVDLILMDIDLGTGIDGTQAAEIILRTRDIPILFLSSHTEPEIVHRTEKITSNGYVVKNSGATVLLASIRMAFRIHEAHRQNLLKTEELESANRELNATIHELEETNDTLQETNVELEEAKIELEMLLAEHRRAEKALVQSESEFRSLFEASPAGAALLKDRLFRKVNTQMCEMMGYSAEEILGRSTRLFYLNDEDFERSGIELYSLIEREGRGTLEMSLKRRDGTVIDVLLSGSPIDTNDISAGIAVTVLDFTERKRAEYAVMQSELEFRSLFEASPAGAALLKDRKFLKVNTFLCSMMEYSPAELVGQYARVLYLNDEEYERAGKELYAQIKDHGYGTVETRFRKKSGSIIDIFISGCPIYKDDPARGVATSLMDITERKKAEAALKQSESEFRSMFEASPAGATLLKDRIFLKVNTQMCEMMGYTSDELLGQSTRLFYLNDEDFERCGRELYGQMEREGRGSLEMLLVRKDGTVIDTLLSASPLDKDDVSAGLAVTVLDFTERKRAEAALLQSESEFRGIFNASPAGIAVLVDRIFVKVNAVLCSLSGYSEEELVGQSVRMMYQSEEEFNHVGEELYTRILRDGIGRMEAVLQRKDGVLSNVWLCASAIEHRGTPNSIAITVLDITDRKRSENALRLSEERWQFAIEGSDDGVWDWNVQTDEIYYSRRWKTMLGYDEDEIGNTLEEWKSRIHPDDRERVLEAVQRHMNVVSSIYTSEYRIRCKKDGYKWILDRGKLISRTPDGRPLRMIGTHTDISERKTNEEAAARALAEKEALLHELQHRVKNNLAMINGIIDLETERVGNGEMRAILESLRARIDSLVFLYGFLFQSDTVMTVILGAYIESIVHSLEGVYITGMSAVRIERRFDPVVAGAKDATAWGLIVNELLINALKYAFATGEPGVIRIDLAQKDGSIVLAVSDNGRGLPPDFDLDRSTGLGLLLVKTLALQLGGTLSIECGKENVFSVRIRRDS